MSSPSPHPRHPLLAGGPARSGSWLAPLLRVLLAGGPVRFDVVLGALAATTALVSGCGNDLPPTSTTGGNYDDDFGGEAPRFPKDAGSLLDGGTGGELDAGDEVIVRFVHALANVGPLYVCHDPDLVLDDPLTAETEESAGLLDPVVLLPLETSFGASDAVTLPALSTGTLSVHVRPPTASAEGGVSFPTYPKGDAGSTDAGASAEPADCSAATRVAALTLAPDSKLPPGDAGTERAKTSLTSGPLFLIASGVALDRGRLDEREKAAQEEYRAKNPGDEPGALLAGRTARAAVESMLGPMLSIESATYTNPPMNAFRLALAQLTPDVSSLMSGPGGVRVCVTAGTLEKPVEPASPKEPAIAFRDTVMLAPSYETGSAYRFRVFPAAKFDSSMTSGGNFGSTTTGQDCSTTGLAPLAELSVPKETLVGGHAYQLLFMGAVAPSSLCAPVDETSFVRAGCPVSPDKLGARLLLIE